jgi:diguanylate cyclase (GGDEF)-like protein/putative nucleotidyltransferase with HDIG domain
MSAIEMTPDEWRSATERLLERGWEGRERRASHRELLVDATASALFLTAAGALVLLAGPVTFNPGIAALLITVYALVGRIEFAVGAGYVVPTQLVLVPMLMMLPPTLVPLAVATGLVIGNAVEWALGRVRARRVLSAVPDAWHAVAPALVLVAAGSPELGFGQLPLLAGAFAAGCIVDLLSSMIRVRLSGVVPELRLQMQVIAFVWVVDASLAPLGFMAGIVSRRHQFAILLVLPLVFLLWLLARDRTARIDQAHQRLKLVEHERARLQSAVRRLGDAFAAKLELSGLLEILLQGSIEALDAAAGQLHLSYGRSPIELTAGALGLLAPSATCGAIDDGAEAPAQVHHQAAWRLTVPLRISSAARPIAGALQLVRPGRAFEADEVALIGELIDKAELAAAEIIAHHEIREQAMTDSLTGLGNRRRLGVELERAFDAGPSAAPSLLALFDLDGFKDYNDTFGHTAGDELLARLGGRLQRAVEGFGNAYRLGGDEFCAHLELAGRDADALLSRAAGALSETRGELTVAASLGLVVLPQEADNVGRAMRLADERMYANKRSRSTAARSQAGEVLVRTMRAREPELEAHSGHVAELSVKVARRLGLAGEHLEEVSRAAQLHDIGKVAIPDEVLNKSSRLDEGDWELIRSHTILGEQILHGAPALHSVARLVRASHERWDGSGYPDRLRGEEIPLGARIVSVCDAYEAMTADRPYQTAVPHDAACRELERCAGRQFDPTVVEAFLAVVRTRGDELELDAAQHAAAHVRTLLGAGAPERVR